MLCLFQAYSKVIQLYIYMYLFFFKFFSHLGGYIILSRVPCAMDLEIVILSEVSQTEKGKYPMKSLICRI